MGHCPGPRIAARLNFQVVYRAQSGTGSPFFAAMAVAAGGQAVEGVLAQA